MKPRLDSRALGLFVAVAESLSFRQAAETLHLSQPPLSRAIRELEARLGTRLFERDTRSVALTPAGERLLPRARHILQLLREAEADVAAGSVVSTLRLGLTSAVEPAWFEGLVGRLVAAQPGLAVTAVSGPSPQLVRQLRAQRLQAAFIALPTEAEGLEVVEIERQPMCVALPSGHRLARRRQVGLADLVGEPVFWFERARQPAFFDHCQRVFARHGFAPGRLREPADHHVLLAEVAAARGLALLPESFRTLRRGGVVYRALAQGDELGVGLGLALPPGRAALRSLLLAAAGPG
jgi:DNA-binding transcriptional LysR family regulator